MSFLVDKYFSQYRGLPYGAGQIEKTWCPARTQISVTPENTQ